MDVKHHVYLLTSTSTWLWPRQTGHWAFSDVTWGSGKPTSKHKPTSPLHAPSSNTHGALCGTLQHRKDIDRLEAVQRKAARFALNRHQKTASVKQMLQELNWPSLEQLRWTARLSMLYKINSGLAAVKYPLLKKHPKRARRSQTSTFERIPCRADYRLNSCFPGTGTQLIIIIIIKIIKRISRALIYHTRWQHRALYNNTNHIHTHSVGWGDGQGCEKQFRNNN